MSIFNRGFIRGYGKIEAAMGDEAVYKNPERTSTTTVTVVYNELVGAYDQFQNAVFHLRSDSVTIERNGQLIYQGFTWDIVDNRDSEDGTAEVRCTRPDLTS